MKFNYFDGLLVYVMSVFIRYSLCTLCYIYKDKENYRTSSEVHKTITAGGTVLKSILILHLADVGTIPTIRWCEDSKNEKCLSINIRKITPELMKLRVPMFCVQHRAKLSCHCHNHRQCVFSYSIQDYKECPKSPFTESIFRSERNNFICNEDGTGLHTPLTQQWLRTVN